MQMWHSPLQLKCFILFTYTHVTAATALTVKWLANTILLSFLILIWGHQNLYGLSGFGRTTFLRVKNRIQFWYKTGNKWSCLCIFQTLLNLLYDTTVDRSCIFVDGNLSATHAPKNWILFWVLNGAVCVISTSIKLITWQYSG